MLIYALIAAVLHVAKTFNSIHYQDCLPRYVAMIGPFHECSQIRHAVAKLQGTGCRIVGIHPLSIHLPSVQALSHSDNKLACEEDSCHPAILFPYLHGCQSAPSQPVGQLAGCMMLRGGLACSAAACVRRGCTRASAWGG